MLDLDVRIDTVAWEVPLVHGVPPELVGAVSGSIDVRDPRRSKVRWIHLRGLDLPGAMQVRSAVDWTGRSFLVVEGSVPKVLDGHNVVGLAPNECAEAMELVESRLPIEGLPAVEPGARVLRRLDVVRDFWPAPSGAALIRALGTDPVFRRTGVDRYLSGRGGRGATLVRGPVGRRSVLYDKSAEVLAGSRRLAPESRKELCALAQDRVRYELRLRGQDLRAVVGRSLDDLDESRTLAAARANFSGVRFDATVVGRSGLVEALAGLDETAARKVSLAGAVLFEAAGIDPGLSERTRQANRRVLRDLGITFDDVLPGLYGSRLDFEKGEEERALRVR